MGENNSDKCEEKYQGKINLKVIVKEKRIPKSQKKTKIRQYS